MIKSGFLSFNPSILQLRSELSLLIDLDVEIMLSYFDLIKCAVIRDFTFVIHLDERLIVKLSFENAILASINGIFFYLFK